MKYFICSVCLLTCLVCIGQKNAQSADDGVSKEIIANKHAGPGVPEELLTSDGIYWTITNDSTIAPVSTSPGVVYNNVQPGTGMIVKFKFFADNRFEFISILPAGTNGNDAETSTKVEGKVIFTMDEKGQQVFKTEPEKGQSEVTRNGVTSAAEIPADELVRRHSNRYLWGKSSSPADPKSTYLLLIDLDAHPSADISKPITIHPDWVSKFHTRRNGS